MRLGRSLAAAMVVLPIAVAAQPAQANHWHRLDGRARDVRALAAAQSACAAPPSRPASTAATTCMRRRGYVWLGGV